MRNASVLPAQAGAGCGPAAVELAAEGRVPDSVLVGSQQGLSAPLL